MGLKRTLTLEMLVKGLVMKFEGRTYDEIAKTLGCSRTTVVRWLPHIERILRDSYLQIRVGGGEVRTEDISKRLDWIQKELADLKRELGEIKDLTLKLLQHTS